MKGVVIQGDTLYSGHTLNEAAPTTIPSGEHRFTFDTENGTLAMGDGTDEIVWDAELQRITVNGSPIVRDTSGGELEAPDDFARKFFVNYDQNAIEAATVKTNIAAYEQYGFDGMRLTINIDPHPKFGVLGSPNTNGLGDSFWTTDTLYWPGFAAALANLLTTNFNRHQKNYLELKIRPSTTRNLPPCDFFNPAFEASVVHNWRMIARFCRAAYLRGVWFDMEPDSVTPGWSLWDYDDRPNNPANAIGTTPTKTVEEYHLKAFYWGRRIMEVVQEEFPDFEFHMAFLYGVVGTATNKYDLYKSYLDGMFYAKKPACKVFEWGEEMYNRYQQNFLEIFKALTYEEHPAGSDTDYYRARHSSAIRMDAAPFDGDPALFQTGLQNQALYGSDEVVNVYQEGRRFFAGTATAAEVAALRAAQVTLGNEYAFDPSLLQGLQLWVRPRALGLADTNPIVTFTDHFGLTECVPTNAPTYSALGIGGTYPGIRFVTASEMRIDCDDRAGQFSGTDKGWTIGFVVDLIALPAGTNCPITIGKSDDADPRISVRYTAAPLLTSQRVSDSGTSDIAFGTSPTYTPTTAAAIIFIGCDGPLGTWMSINGGAFIYDPQATIGAQTFDQITLGALRQITVSQWFNDVLADCLFYNRPLGLREVKYLAQGLGVENGIVIT